MSARFLKYYTHSVNLTGIRVKLNDSLPLQSAVKGTTNKLLLPTSQCDRGIAESAGSARAGVERAKAP